MNYFELFGFPFAPRIDKALVSQKYFELQKSNHPDFFTQASEEEKEEALKQSSDINKAFAIFKNEDKTIEYFLQQKGAIKTDEKYQLPNDFLMEMMELNETLLEKDSKTVTAGLSQIEQPLLAAIQPILQQTATEFDAASIEKLKSYYYKKKYLKRILDRLDD